jgi:hypothetical protein
VRLGRRQALLGALSGAALAAWPARARALGRPDRDVLERLLGMERRLESAYAAAARRGVMDRRLAELLRDQEHAHAEGLERALGAGPRAPVASVPPPDLARALASGGHAFLRYAAGLESAAVAAYSDAATSLHDDSLLQPLGSIMASEGQHLVALRRELGARPLTRAFELGRRSGGAGGVD